MSENQPSFTSPEEEATHSTTPETPITANSRSRSKSSPSSAKKLAPQRQRQPQHKRTRETSKPAIAGPRAQEVNALETTTEQGKKATVTRKRVTSSRKKLKERQEAQAPASEVPGQETLPVSIKPVIETLPAEPEEQITPTGIEPGVIASAPEMEVSRLEPEAGILPSGGAINRAPTMVETEVEILPEIIEAPPERVPAVPQRFERRRVAGKVLAGMLLVILIGSYVLLWRDLTDTHLYLYALDPASGQMLAQQDLGGGYQGNTTITNLVQARSSLVFGVQTDQSTSVSKQQLFFLAGNNNSWQVASQFPAPLTHGTLSLAPGQHLIVVHANGLQVMTTGGHVLWQMQGDEPTQGTHLFQPAFDGSTLYTIKSAQSGMVAAYDLLSGAVRWTQKLNDTCAYAAPFLLYGNMLYIAADHTLSALNSADGTLLWQINRPARTLLILAQGQPLLLAAGSQGLAALSPFTGAIVWSFSGQPKDAQASTNETLVPAQFYQASIASTNHVIYATGIVWDAQQVREQLWLFAVDATTGNVRWSERIGSGFTSADAGRIYPPVVDTTHGLVILQQAQDDGRHILAAYNTGDGTQRWRIKLEGITAAAPSPLQVSNTALITFNTQWSSVTALHSVSPVRLLLTGILGVSALWLLLLWMLPLRRWTKRLRSTLHNLSRYLAFLLNLPVRLWHFSRTVCTLALLVLLVWGGVLAHAQLVRPQSYLNQVATSSGHTQWQRSIETPAQLAMADTLGSIVITSAGESQHQLTSLDLDGAAQWTGFASEGSFSLPTISTQPATVLAVLSGHTSPRYRFAPDDPAYMHPLDSLYTLYLLNRKTGQIIWQNTIVGPQEQQDTTVLGADKAFIYVASRATSSLSPGISPVVQLIAVNRKTGNIAWRIFGPQEPATASTDFGSLLLQGRSIIWQVANTIYALDTSLGQIEWHRYIVENLPQAYPHEAAQMAETAGVLLIARSNAYHAFDLATGNERWVITNPANGTSQTPGGVVAASNIFLIYGGEAVQAIDPTDQHIIWSQKRPEAIQSLKISLDGTIAYAILLKTLPAGTTTQLLEALDVQTGVVRWTFQPFAQERFVNMQSDGFQYSKSTLYATLYSQMSCDHEVLYAINAAMGETGWKFAANSIYNVRVSPDGDTVAFQTDSSTWGNLIEHF
jgi:outer membrane protein assembly factor BamB